MILTLEVTGPQSAKLGAARRKIFDATGGTIGRLRENDWSLPDPYVSSRHAVIRYENGDFYIEDTSMNGVFVNAADNRLVKGQRYQLQHNDWIFIEPYEIRASLEEAAPASPSYSPLDDPFAPPSRAPRTPGPAPAGYAPPPLIPADEEVDPMKLLGESSPRQPVRRGPRAEDLQQAPAISEHYQPPAVKPPSRPPTLAAEGLIPTNYDPFADVRDSAPTPPSSIPPPAPAARPSPPATPPDAAEWLPPSRPAPGPVPRPGGRPASRPQPIAAPVPEPAADPIADMLRGAGIDPAAVTPQLAQDFGRILRLVVGGVMDVLQARQRVKSEFRMDMTTFRVADNNPLKFSANVDDALHNLLVKRNAAFLNPVDAFGDAFDDIRNHQMAMLAGMRVAFEAMLAQFDPDRLQQEFDQQMKRGSLISVPAKLRYWDLYGAKIRDMVKDADATFRELFGDEFAAAYEEQLKRLKSRGGDNQT